MRPRVSVRACLASILVSTAAVTGLGACGPGPGPGAAGTGPQPIVIGASVSITGLLASFGSYLSWGYQHAVAQVNARGGISIDGTKRRVQLVLIDDESSPRVSAANQRILVSAGKAVALLGSNTPAQINPGAAAANRLGVPMVTGSDPIKAFTSAGKWTWVWDIFFYEPDLAAAPFQTMAAYRVRTNRKIAILHDTGPDGAVVGGQLWPQLARRYGYRVAVNLPFPPDATRLSAPVRAARRSGADVMLVDSGTPQAVAIRKRMAADGYTPKILDMEKGAEPAQFARDLGPLANGVLVGGYWDKSFPYPGASELARAYLRETGQNPSQHIADSYTAAMVLLNAIQSAGSTDARKINQAIAATDKVYPVGRVKFSARHTSRIRIAELQWQGGKTAVVWPRAKATGPFLVPP